MRAVAECLPPDIPLLLMDTGVAAVLGCLEDEVVAQARHKVILNLGNAHALAFYLQGEEILGLWEHHTRRLTPARVAGLIQDLVTGTLDGAAIFAEGGHGGYARPGVQYGGKPDIICLTGPQRRLLSGNGYYAAAPYGQMMLTGPYGLVRAWEERSDRLV